MELAKKYNINIRGKGPCSMIFAHGFIGSQDLWKFVAPAFDDTFKSVLFDYIGCGKSDHHCYDAEKYSRLEGYADDLVEVCKGLGLNQPVFVGHSVSCMIGLIATTRIPGLFSKMIFLTPSPRYLNDAGYQGGFTRNQVDQFMSLMRTDYEGWAKQTVQAVIDAPQHEELAQELIQSLLSRDQKIAMEFAAATFFCDYRQQLLQLKTPCLILQSKDDVMVPYQVTDYLHAHLINSTVKLLDTKGHFPQLSAPGEVVAEIGKFLKPSAG